MKNEIYILIKKFYSGEISSHELEQLSKYCQDHTEDSDLADIHHKIAEDATQKLIPIDVSDRIFNKILQETHPQRSRGFVYKYKRIIVGAAAVLIAGIITFYFYSPDYNKNSDLMANVSTSEQITAGSTKAVVELEDGRIIDLDDLDDNAIIQLDGYSIKKEADGSIKYLFSDQLASSNVLYNTIVTPRGGEYKLVLSDGTKVWLNASTKMRYPLHFGTLSRQVELSGEAYFDVSKVSVGNRKLPFIVRTGKQNLEVLGTEFNINTYGRNIETTLVEGAVQLSFDNQSPRKLEPNQQARYNQADGKIGVEEVNVFYITAWKNGSFAFENASIREVMSALSRWYDIEVDYQGNVEDVNFTGTISRYENIDKVLNIVSLTGSVNFKIQGRRVLVMK